MTIPQPRAAHKAEPFPPFPVHIADGRAITAPHPNSLSMSPTGRTAIIDPKGEDFRILDLIL